jgi:hypothetical protein
MTTDNIAMPVVVDPESFRAQLEELRVREKAHTREGDAIAAPRRRLPMVEVDATTSLTGPDGPSSLLEARPPGWLGGRTSATLMAMAAALLFAFLIIESSVGRASAAIVAVAHSCGRRSKCSCHPDGSKLPDLPIGGRHRHSFELQTAALTVKCIQQVTRRGNGSSDESLSFICQGCQTGDHQ